MDLCTFLKHSISTYQKDIALCKNKPHSCAGSVNEETHNRCDDARDQGEAIDQEDKSIHGSVSY